jgi:2-methylcitrate dehydratase
MTTLNINNELYRDEVAELIAHYVVNVSGTLSAATERSVKSALIDSIAVSVAALRHPAAQAARFLLPQIWQPPASAGKR